MEKKYKIFLYLLSLILIILAIIAYFSPNNLYIALWKMISDLGDERAYMVYSVLIYHLISTRIGFLAVISLLFSGALSIMIKEIFKVPRPLNPKIEVTGFSFPSGHAQTSAAFWGSISLSLKEKAIILLSVVFISIVSISRLALNVHYLTDILGGIFFGFIVALVFYLVLKNWITEFVLLLLISIYSLLNFFLLSNDLTLIKISGISLGLLLHPFLFKKEIKKIKFSFNLFIFIINLILILFLSIISKGVIDSFIFYILIGLSIPIFRFIAIKLI